MTIKSACRNRLGAVGLVLLALVAGTACGDEPVAEPHNPSLNDAPVVLFVLNERHNLTEGNFRATFFTSPGSFRLMARTAGARSVGFGIELAKIPAVGQTVGLASVGAAYAFDETWYYAIENASLRVEAFADGKLSATLEGTSRELNFGSAAPFSAKLTDLAVQTAPGWADVAYMGFRLTGASPDTTTAGIVLAEDISDPRHPGLNIGVLGKPSQDSAYPAMQILMASPVAGAVHAVFSSHTRCSVNTSATNRTEQMGGVLVITRTAGNRVSGAVLHPRSFFMGDSGDASKIVHATFWDIPL